jgi:hypothetical protein
VSPLTQRFVVPALLLALAGCSGGGGAKPSATPTPPPSPDIAGVKVFADQVHTHVTHKVDYPNHPPTGGPHWAPTGLGVYGWQACAVYTEPVVDEFAVHSLEHGAVWLTYLPTVPAAEVDKLKELDAIRADYVIVSPYPGQQSPVMATAWGLQLGVTSANDARLAQFVREYAGGGQGGELGADCAHGATLAQARDALSRSGG